MNPTRSVAAALLSIVSIAALAQESQSGDADIALDELLAGTTPDSPPDSPPAAPAEVPAETASPAEASSPPPAAPSADSNPQAAPEAVETIPVAQREEAPKGNLPEPRHSPQLEEIVVTATKREKSVRDIPVTVNALDGEALARSGMQDTRDYLPTVPGVTLNDISGGVGRINMRGIAVESFNAQGGSSTGVLINDAGFSDPANALFNPDVNTFDLQTVEIMKGPQGTLFGAGGLSGAIRYTLRQPQLGVWQSNFFAQSDSVHEGGTKQTYGASANIPIGQDRAALRIVGVSRQTPGVVDDFTGQKHEVDADSSDQQSGRILGTWQLTDSLTLSGFYLRQKQHQDSVSWVNNDDGVLVRDNTAGPNTADSAFDVASMSLSAERDWATVTLNVSRVTKDFALDNSYTRDLVPAPLWELDLARYTADQAIEGWQQELRFVSPGGERFEWIGGFFAQQYDTDTGLNVRLKNPVALGFGDLSGVTGLADLITFRGPVAADEIAVFGEGTGRFFDSRLEATLGVRLYRTESQADISVGGLVVYALTGQLTPSRKTGTISEDGINPKAALTWHFSDSLSVYTSAARGYRFGGFNNTPDTLIDNVPFSYKSDTLWNYELGVRSQWLDDTLQVDVTGFRIDWKDPQVIQPSQSGSLSYTDNIGGARSLGVEAAIRWLTPIEGLSFSFSGAYIDAGTTEAFQSSDGGDVPVGSAMASTPRLQTTTVLAYGFGLPAGWLADTSVTYLNVGEAWSNIGHDHRILGYESWKAGLRVSHPTLWGRPEFSLQGDNLMDERALGAAVGGDRIYIRPRAVSLRLGLSFGD